MNEVKRLHREGNRVLPKVLDVIGVRGFHCNVSVKE
jgi:hypothetical protein